MVEIGLYRKQDLTFSEPLPNASTLYQANLHPDDRLVFNFKSKDVHLSDDLMYGNKNLQGKRDRTALLFWSMLAVLVFGVCVVLYNGLSKKSELKVNSASPGR